MKPKKHVRASKPKHRPVYVRVGAIVQKGAYRVLLLDERVTALSIAGPFPRSASLASDPFPPDEDIPF